MILKTHESNIEMKQEFSKVIDGIYSFELYNPENQYKLNANGVYFSKGYYCVKTEGRRWDDIKMTDYHEMCHAFVNMDYGHFCNSSNQTNNNIEEYIR